MKKNLEIIHPFAAGIDIGSRDFYVDAGEEKIRVFPTFTEDCNYLCEYLLAQKITTVAMEATGVYWVVLYSMLEAVGKRISPPERAFSVRAGALSLALAWVLPSILYRCFFTLV